MAEGTVFNPEQLRAAEIMRAAGNALYLHGKDLFRCHDEHGLPWDMIFQALRDRDMELDLRGLCLEFAGHYGWENQRIVNEIGRDLRESFGMEWYDRRFRSIFPECKHEF